MKSRKIYVCSNESDDIGLVIAHRVVPEISGGATTLGTLALRTQVHRQRGEIRQLQRAGISTASAEALLERMLTAIDGMCAERDKLRKELAGPTKGKVLGGRSWHV